MGQQKPKLIEAKVEEKEEKIEIKKEERVEVKPSGKVQKAKPPRVRGKNFQKAKSLIEKKFYPILQALELVKKTSYVGFDASIEVHINFQLGKKTAEPIRGTVQLPHSTGKKLKVVILDEKAVEEILKTKKTAFDLALAKPEFLPKLNKIAKILGPKGLMPNEKVGTVTSQPKKLIQEIEKGKIIFKTDSFGILHQVIGKVSWDSKKILENFKTLLSVLPQNQISSIFICSTMGPAVQVAI